MLLTAQVSYQNTTSLNSPAHFDDGGSQIDGILSVMERDYLLSMLTKRQREVSELLAIGYSRKNIAAELHICVQAVHQIILRIRKRLRQRGKIHYETARQAGIKARQYQNC